MAKVEKIKADIIAASYGDGKLLLFAQGNMHDSCIRNIRFVRSPLTVEPPKFIIERVLTDDQICGKRITPWQHIDVFDIGVYRENINIEDASGVQSILVSWIVPLGEKEKATTMGGGGEIPVPFFTFGSGLLSGMGIAEAVGYSDALSFDEALKDALKNLPPAHSGYPDQLTSYTITSISAEFGGFAGVHRLRVAIRGYR